MPDAATLSADELALIAVDVAGIPGAVLLLPKVTILRLLATVRELTAELARLQLLTPFEGDEFGGL